MSGSANNQNFKVLTDQMGRSIPYFTNLRYLTGSLFSAILMGQLEYFFLSNPDGFSKFIDHCDHPKYVEDSSWREHVSFTANEFTTAFSKIGISYLSTSRGNAARDKHRFFKNERGEEFFYARVFDRASGQTTFYKNYPKVNAALESLLKDEYKNSSYGAGGTMESLRGSQGRSRKFAPKSPETAKAVSQKPEFGKPQRPDRGLQRQSPETAKAGSETAKAVSLYKDSLNLNYSFNYNTTKISNTLFVKNESSGAKPPAHSIFDGSENLPENLPEIVPEIVPAIEVEVDLTDAPVMQVSSPVSIFAKEKIIAPVIPTVAKADAAPAAPQAPQRPIGFTAGRGEKTSLTTGKSVDKTEPKGYNESMDVLSLPPSATALAIRKNQKSTQKTLILFEYDRALALKHRHQLLADFKSSLETEDVSLQEKLLDLYLQAQKAVAVCLRSFQTVPATRDQILEAAAKAAGGSVSSETVKTGQDAGLLGKRAQGVLKSATDDTLKAWDASLLELKPRVLETVILPDGTSERLQIIHKTRVIENYYDVSETAEGRPFRQQLIETDVFKAVRLFRKGTRNALRTLEENFYCRRQKLEPVYLDKREISEWESGEYTRKGLYLTNADREGVTHQRVINDYALFISPSGIITGDTARRAAKSAVDVRLKVGSGEIKYQDLRETLEWMVEACPGRELTLENALRQVPTYVKSRDKKGYAPKPFQNSQERNAEMLKNRDYDAISRGAVEAFEKFEARRKRR